MASKITLLLTTFASAICLIKKTTMVAKKTKLRPLDIAVIRGSSKVVATHSTIRTLDASQSITFLYCSKFKAQVIKRRVNRREYVTACHDTGKNPTTKTIANTSTKSNFPQRFLFTTIHFNLSITFIIATFWGSTGTLCKYFECYEEPSPRLK